MRLRGYPRYKASGAEWLGDVPQHWEVTKLGRHIELLTGFPFESERFSFIEGIPLLRGDNVTEGRLRWGEKARYWPESTVGLERYLLQAGDIVIGMDGSKVGKNFATVQAEDLPLLLVQRVARLRVGAQLDRCLLHRLIESEQFRIWVELTKTDPAIPHVSPHDIAAYPVALPPVREQHAIGDFLDRETAKIDALLAKKRTLIERLKEKRTALISRTVTRGLPPAAARAAGLDPHRKLKPSGIDWIGDIPVHWIVKPVKSIARVGNGSTPNRDNAAYWDGGHFPWLNSSVVNEQAVTEAVEFVTAIALAECHLPRVRPPAVLVGITGQGRTRGMATTLLVEATINQHIAFVAPVEAAADVRFIRRVFDTAYEYLRSESDGAGSTKGAITCEQIAGLRIALPPVQEQRVIASFLERETAELDAMATKVQTAIERLQEYRTALITAAVTGKIDVRGTATSDQRAEVTQPAKMAT